MHGLKRSNFFYFFYILCLLLLGNLKVCAAEKSLNLVFAGNMPNISNTSAYGYSDLAAIIQHLRAQPQPTLFTFTGGSLGPSSLSSLDRGSHIIDILNSLEPDLMTLTKREFSYYEDELTLRTYEAAFPFVSSNLYDPLLNANLEGVLSSIVIEKNNTKVGFVAILDEEVVEEYLLKRVEVFEPQNIINQQIIQLKQQGAELIILVYSKERDYYQDLLAESKVDLAVQVSSTLDSPISHRDNDKIYTVSYESPITVLTINWQSQSADKTLQISEQQLNLSALPKSTETAVLVNEYQQRLNRLLEQKIGTLAVDMSTEREKIRTQEMSFGNFIADAMKHYGRAEIGLINSGVIRGDKRYPQGANLTRRDLASELPFRTYLEVVEISGQQLKLALENAVSGIESAKGRFLQVSGLQFSYSTQKPIGNRTQDILVNGQPLDYKQTYRVATTNYIANGGDGFDMLQSTDAELMVAQSAPLISDLVIRTIQRKKAIAPKVENRIRRLD